MKRQFARIERRALLGLAAALTSLGAASCTPNTSVKPGAPVLTEIAIFDPAAGSVTHITPDTGECPAGTVDTGGCDPTASPLCFLASAKNWCQCNLNPPPPPPPAPADASADAAISVDGATSLDGAVSLDAGSPDAGLSSDGSAPPLAGSWSCAPFSPTSSPFFVFDRLLATAPLDPGDAATGPTNVATVTVSPQPPSTISVSADYASNGSPNEVIFPLLGAFRADGPSLLFSGQPALPAGFAITITLNPDKVTAKDGKSSFIGTAPTDGGADAGTPGAVDFRKGTITFTTALFSGSLTAPSPPPPDPGTDGGADAGVALKMTPATARFNNFVNPADLATHVSAVAVSAAGTAPVALALTSMDGLTVSIGPAPATPTSTPVWPKGATITIAIDATAADVVGDKLATPIAPVTFTTSAS
jgi:hypothetical protein